MTTHTLQKEKHNDFLAQNRIDPITGDLLKENDEIVICAACKSAFLVDSWEYMDRKHCNQKITLKEIPVSEVVRIERPYLIDLKTVKIFANYQEARITIFPYFLLGYFVSFLLDHFSLINISYSAFLVMLICYCYVYFGSKKSYYKNSFKIEDNTLFFNLKENTETKMKVKEIQTIELYKSRRHWFDNVIRDIFLSKNSRYTIKITAKNKSVYKLLLQKKELERVSKETNFLQKFDKNSLPFLSVNEKRLT
ncbi:hypothetical protein WAF17_20580 [Bernardetia sp. ABR2-2B]|uniref:hypothetical protein n=1 Tax=Bernardetia sp. ABR2-2B TaxID=3127472 RepID=UPI0030D4E0E2